MSKRCLVCGFVDGTENLEKAWAAKHRRHLALTASALPLVKVWRK